MNRISLSSVVSVLATGAVLAFSGCAGASADLEEDSPSANEGVTAGSDADAGTGAHFKADSHSSADAIGARVVESVIQRDRVVVTLDAGSRDGVLRGMRGTMDNGRAFTVISVDLHTCRVVVVGLNLRFAVGSTASIFR